ncbi:hypothetical protein DTW90_36140 [Neorhizobium sp. P12A]|uniref:hypothetical protein n=1 Tax=Neorhizobium sp. P12A TaxID=2268027 RepID=UPI0011EC6D3F|nr:hypothetical protein [Neorhizobium sp. P12A]KAA0684572.1 hypothetical protein DTW90_36140 [Neorhizobium sp. P12A]
MSDSYRAIYDAVRSRISGGDIGAVIQQVAQERLDISFAVSIIQQEFVCAAQEMQRPSVIFKPSLIQDGNAWLAIYGDLPTGVVGTGETPAAAMYDFDASWLKKAVAPPGYGFATPNTGYERE